MTVKRKLTAKQLDALHDSGADMSAHLDLGSARRPGLEIQRVNVDFPIWMVESLDEEAGRLGVPRQSVIKFLISECLTGKRPGKMGDFVVNEDAPRARRRIREI
jgi:hypothetical protein